MSQFNSEIDSELSSFLDECIFQSESLMKIKQSQQAEFIIQMGIDLVMDSNLKVSDVVDLPAIKFKAFRAMAFCKL
jgi:hypothetical protein